ncbi:alpha/beta hydrolase [Desulfobotulus sp. H1]|uniref:Alpha/beta hydrolase n=1 Tax=Desulfobotulus pelophilus TaxID=2823377 RepID=A0ABT3N846_9BACT|nr:alpha/beta hydrolase [Desulfobotulus pelophilus]MCW7753625.1 alpha/beta hydrolase [Desulfobotulus pelophilus]
MKTARILIAIIILLVAIPYGLLQLFPEKAFELALDAERKQSGLERREIHFSRDLYFVYLEGGQGEPLVLLHGFGADKDNFTRIAKSLTPHYHVIIPDLTGFGESARPDDYDYTPAGQASGLHTFIKGMGLSGIHLGGSSMGGQIAMEYASLFPDSVASLWLLNPGGLWDGPLANTWKELLINGEDAKNPLIIEKEEDLMALTPLVMETPPFIPKVFQKVMAARRIKNAALEKKIFEDILAHPITETIRGLAIPSLIVWGKEDRILHPANADKLKGLLPASEVILMEGVGHLPMVESPLETARAYLDFRGRIREGTQTNHSTSDAP